MTRSRSIRLFASAAAVPLAALTLAGCGNSASGSTSPSTTTRPTTADGRPASVGVANSSLGKILVDSKGRTLYLFKQDKGTKGTCFGACATAWPPLRASGKPTVGSGVSASKIATVARSDGKPQVTYNGHPLYLFEADKNAGDTNGQGVNGFGALWYVLSPAGNQITASASTSGGGGGY